MSSRAAIPLELKGDGVFLDHDERYEVTDEFLSIWRKLMQGEEVTETHKHLRIEKGKLLYPPQPEALSAALFRRLVGGGQRRRRQACRRLPHLGRAARRRRAEDRRRQGAWRRKYGRTFSFGIRLHVIVRETSAEAWRAADDLIAKLDDETIATAQKAFARFDSVGQQRMARLHGGRRDKLEISPNLWAGVGLVRGGAGTALVGNPDEVAERMKEYMALGIDRFILSGYPHLEECYRFAELVFPKLPLKADDRQ